MERRAEGPLGRGGELGGGGLTQGSGGATQGSGGATQGGGGVTRGAEGVTQGGGRVTRGGGGVTRGVGGLETVRAAVEEVARLVVSPSPEVLDRTAVLLKAAVAGFAAVRRGGDAGPEDLRQLQELQQIRRALQHAGALLRKAQQYHAGWGAYLGTRTGGYRAGGQPALLVRGRRFSVEG